MLKIGFSTGALYKSLTDETSRIKTLWKMKCPAIEFGSVRLRDFMSLNLADFLQCALSNFEYRSFHAPTYEYGYNDVTRFIFSKITELNAIAPLDLVVFHPDGVLDFGVFKNLPFPIGFENMDVRKTSCKEYIELEAILAISEKFSLVLDLNHIYSNDRTMKSAGEFYERLGLKISQIHVSGYDGHHAPLFRTGQSEIIRAIRDPSAPIIIEGVMGPEDLRKEMFYIVKQIAMDGFV